jgi:25S rRNA (adenine2142-N1)-methyltransferase
MARKRPIPITQRNGTTGARADTKKAAGKSHKATQSTISSFHTLLKRQAQVKRALSRDGSSAQAAMLQAQLSEIDKAISDLGGLDSYQKASTLGQSNQRGGDSSVVLVEWLKELGEAKLREDPLGQERKIRSVKRSQSRGKAIPR